MSGHLQVVSGGAWSTQTGCSSDEELFAQLYQCCYDPVLDYCRRRLSREFVEDAVAETFLTAWRRLDAVPPGDAALVWLYGVAYRVVGHQWRSTARRRRLDVRLRSLVRRPVSGADEAVVDGLEQHLVLEASARLGERDVEVLRLVAWEQLSVGEVATVLEITPNAAAQRLHRAKRNLAREY